MSRLAVHANTFHPLSFADALRGARAAGFDAIELSAVPGWTEHIDYDMDPRKVADQVAEAGLTAIALSGHSDLTTASGVQYAVRGIEWAAEYGLTLFSTAIGGHAYVEEDARRFIEGFAPVVRAAEANRVTVGLEIHGELMATGQRARPLIDHIGSPWIGVKYDTANCEYYGGVRAQDDIEHIVDRIVSVDAKDHIGGVGDWDFPPPGLGAINWPAVVGKLNEGGFSGPYVVEIEFKDQIWPDYEGIVGALRQARRTLAPLVEGSAP